MMLVTLGETLAIFSHYMSMTVHVAHICSLLKPSCCSIHTNRDLQGCVPAVGAHAHSNGENPGVLLVCLGLWPRSPRGRKVTVPSQEGLGRVPDCHTSSRLFKQPLKMEMHSTL